MKKLKANKELAVLRAERARKGWSPTDWYCEKGNVITAPLRWHSQPYRAEDVGNCQKCPHFDYENCYCSLGLFFTAGECVSEEDFLI